jgi:hypothetical protein
VYNVLDYEFLGYPKVMKRYSTYSLSSIWIPNGILVGLLEHLYIWVPVARSK